VLEVTSRGRRFLVAGPSSRAPTLRHLFDSSDGFVAENDRKRNRKLTFPEVNIVPQMPAISVRTNAAPVRISWAAKLSKREWRVERFEDGGFGVGHNAGTLLKRDYLFNPSSQKKQLATKKHRKHKGKKTLRRKRLSSDR